jgi:7-cyano-7-deazaguanine synthase
LTADIEVPKARQREDIGEGVPITYVPARNTIFLAIALGWAEVLGSTDLFLGVNAVDYSGYPDCRPAFLRAFESLAQLATVAGAEEDKPLRIHAPLMKLSKQGIVERGLELGVDFGLTHTCYDPVLRGTEILACGECDACHLRLEGFREAGQADPVPYVSGLN